MVVSGFRRSLSFPNQSNKPRKTLHVRSTSLPCRSSSHPVISQLKDEISELKSRNSSEATCVSVCEGLKRLKIVHESLDDFLQLPQTKESLSCNSDLIEKFLEDFLRFVDVYGIFQTLFLTLKQEYLAVQMAVKRKDETKIAMHVKNLSKIAKEIGKLESSVQSIGKNYLFSDNFDAEFAEIIRDVIEVTVSVSVSLFGGLSAALGSRKPPRMGLSWKKVKVRQGIQEFQQINLETLMGLRKKDDEEMKMVCKKMQELVEDCMVGIESCGERSFRSLINTRVSLLNFLTQ
ncbi:Hypothetical predicted protein [Olea europaea subsp. europaea]|uniref:DUF241 domain protein n=1 Tax=Olea europaea subsp. europaea TaxID=158383 RepID=A0A8S0QE23_OLEEU|nr:Hypothetical predicted protein [Olea europaea subsp. europaea]